MNGSLASQSQAKEKAGDRNKSSEEDEGDVDGEGSADDPVVIGEVRGKRQGRLNFELKIEAGERQSTPQS